MSLMLLDLERVTEVFDLMGQSQPSTLYRWLVLLESDLADFKAMISLEYSMERQHKIVGAAHALKGSCLNMGASALAMLFAALEAHAKAGEWAEIKLCYAQCRETEILTLKALKKAWVTH